MVETYTTGVIFLFCLGNNSIVVFFVLFMEDIYIAYSDLPSHILSSHVKPIFHQNLQVCDPNRI